MNTRQKGGRIQRKAMEHYKELGFQVWPLERSGLWITQKDNWGLFDFEALKGKTLIKVQCTCNKPHTHKHYQDFADNHASEHLLIEQIVWMDRKGFKKFKYFPDKKILKEVLY